MEWFWDLKIAQFYRSFLRAQEIYRNKSHSWKQEKDDMNRKFSRWQKAEARKSRRIAQANFLAGKLIVS